MARLLFSMVGGVALFAILALGVWRANGGDNAQAVPPASQGAAAPPAPTPLVVAAPPHPPGPCTQFVDLMPLPAGMSRNMGQALFLAVARGDEGTEVVWQTDPPLRDQLWD